MKNNMYYNKTNIRPRDPGYFILVFIITFFIIFFVLVAFISEDFPYIFLLPFIIFILYFLIRLLLVKIVLEGKEIRAAKFSILQEETFYAKCSDLVKYDVVVESKGRTYVQSLLFDCQDGSKKRLWIKPYTKRQVKFILQYIKDRGGLVNQQIDDLTIKYL